MPQKASTSEAGNKSKSRDTSRGRKSVNGKSAHAEESPRMLSDRTRRDIIGVIWVLAGIILFLIVVMPQGNDSSAYVTNVFGEILHLVFGVGCYILPFFLIGVGVTYFIRFDTERVSRRVAIGFAIILVALLGFIASFTPIVNLGVNDLSLLFSQISLTSYGGYIGAGIAWVGLALFGQIITCVILSGVMLIGVIVIGFSLSRLIEKIRTAASNKSENNTDEGELLNIPKVRTLRKREDSITPVQSSQFSTQGNTEMLVKPAQPLTPNTATQVLPVQETIPNNKRHKSIRTLNEVSGSALTQKIEPIDPKDQLPIEASTSPSDDIQTTKVLPMTRRLGKKNKVQDNNDEVCQEEEPQQDIQQTDKLPMAFDVQPHPQEGFILPDPALLKSSNGHDSITSEEELRNTSLRLQETLEDFGIMAQVVGWVAGPTVTLFKIDLPSGVRVSRVTALNDDIALALAAPGVRIFAPIPGTNYVGIEVPNSKRQTVLLADILKHADKGPLQIAIGEDVEGHNIVLDLAKMPHLLIGGTTGSGKSVSINAMIMSILMRATPAEVRFILIDPKRVEFTPYNGIPHLYVPVVTEAREAASALSWGVAEMERRLKVFSKVGARNIGQYNAKVQKAKAAEEKARQEGKTFETWEYDDELPYIVIIIDELADLMMNVGKEVEFSISRIAQLARAAGIHLIVATQRPSTNVVTGLIKANITNRIAFNVASGIDSRVILDTPGAENLIGLGDLLLSRPEYAKPQRIQGCFVSEDEINAVVSMLKEQGEPEYHSEILSTNVVSIGSSSPEGVGGSSSVDPLLWDVAEMIVSSGIGSTSNIQRRFKVGYSRAGRIMDQLEEKGIVGASNGSKPREVLVDALELETLKAFEENDNQSSS